MGLGKPVSPNSTPNLLGLSLLKLRISEGMTHTPVQTSIQTKQFKVPALDCEKYPRPLTDEQLTSFYQFLWDITQILIQCNTISEQQKSYKASKETLLEKIQKNLTANGFPEKKVAFPLETLYEKADEAGVNFNQVREELKTLGINTETSGEKIIFSMDTDKGNLFKKAQEMMNQITEQFTLNSAKEQAEAMKENDGKDEFDDSISIG